jgi:ligand-binding sensor domain-containing protein/signal transduction histidine kinase
MFFVTPKDLFRMKQRLSLKNSNTSRDGREKYRWSFKLLSVAIALACFTPSATALSPRKAISQYVRHQWGAEQGFPGGPVYAFAQTPDGYLWIGTEKGLVRFDGFTFRIFQHSEVPVLPDGPVLGLAVDGEGSLWVRLHQPSLLQYRDGVFKDVLPSLKLTEPDVTAMSIGQNGDLLFSGLANGIVRYTKGRFVTVASAAELPRLVISLAETPDHKVWLGTREQGLYYISGGRVSFLNKGLPDNKINSLFAVDSRELWITTDNGIVRWDGSKLSGVGNLNVRGHTEARVIAKDRDSNVWVGTSIGLERIGGAPSSLTERADNLFTDSVTALYEDREGNLWIGTTRGLQRLKDTVFTTYPASGGLPLESNGPIYVDAKGRTWFAPPEGGLRWLKGDKSGTVTNGGLATDVIYSIAGNKNELWLGRRNGGLTRLRYNGDALTTDTFARQDGLAQNSVYAVQLSRDGTVWAGTVSGGLSRLSNGSFKTYTTANGLGSNSILSILESSDGTMWFGTPNGLNSFSKGQWQLFTSRDGLPPGNVNCLLEDSIGALWIGTDNGLAFLNSGSIQIPMDLPESLHEPIFGLEEDRTGSLWIAGARHILRVDRLKMLHNMLSGADIREYGVADGLRSMQGVKRHRSVFMDPLGRVWFSTHNGGLSFVDPIPTTFRSAPALVHLEGIFADGHPISLKERLRVPAPHQRITLNYTGLSLSVPARVLFKYRLDSFDRDWSEPTSAREAIYTNLDSGSYRFHVIASNSDGLWNSSEAVLQFEIEPAFWQTWWFRLSIFLALAIIVLVFFRLRVLQLTRQMNGRFEERLAERTRIAQELHDTLLQGFLSASMQLHVADDLLQDESAAKPLVARVLELMTRVIEDGRNTLRGLRSSATAPEKLEEAFSRIHQDLAASSPAGFRILVEGAPRQLRSAVREDLYFIGREALTNAFRHSGAAHIELEIEYEASYLRILVRDNGCGIDQQVLTTGREGHWGLSGMRERAERIGARLRVLSRATAGTEIDLSVPSRVAYEPDASGHKPARISWPRRRSAYEMKKEGESEQSK